MRRRTSALLLLCALFGPMMAGCDSRPKPYVNGSCWGEIEGEYLELEASAFSRVYHVWPETCDEEPELVLELFYFDPDDESASRVYVTFRKRGLVHTSDEGVETHELPPTERETDITSWELVEPEDAGEFSSGQISFEQESNGDLIGNFNMTFQGQSEQRRNNLGCDFTINVLDFADDDIGAPPDCSAP